MAGKKPAKAVAGQAKQVIKDPALYGQQFMFYGMKVAPSVCQACGKKTIRGMIRIKQEKNYCSERCALSVAVEEAS
jgi:hypothetical protein